MKVLVILFALAVSLLWPFSVVASPEDVVVISAHFPHFTPDVIEDILWVAEKTGQDPFTIASIVDRESTGRREVMSYCLEWATPYLKGGKWKKPCKRWKSCHSGCVASPLVWENHLDVGLWGLRDVVEKMPDKRFAGWSWLRWHARASGQKIKSQCALDRFCSREVMVGAVGYLVGRAEEAARLAALPKRTGREQRRLRALSSDFRCKNLAEEFQWLGGWNGCSSARKHARTTLALRVKKQEFVQRLLLHLWYGVLDILPTRWIG